MRIDTFGSASLDTRGVTTDPVVQPDGIGCGGARSRVVPCLRLSVETLVVEGGDAWSSDLESAELPVIELAFDYGGHRVRASDERDRVFCAGVAGMTTLGRDYELEARARYVLEGFGAVELGCLPEYGAPPDTHADYLVHPDGDVHSICAFSAYALPQLRSLGWQVEVDSAYPYQVLDGEAPWYAELSDEPSRGDWFGLELGVDVEGQRVNMLPVLLDLIKGSAESSLRRLAQGGDRMFALPVGEGRYLPVPNDRVRGIVRVLVELYEGSRRPGMRLTSPLCHAGALERLDRVFADVRGGLRWQGVSGPRNHAKQLAAIERAQREGESPSLPTLRAELRPYQAAGVRWLRALRDQGMGGVLADDMGLGKTLQVIAYLVAEKASGRLKLPALVVCPTSLVGNWMSELARFAPALRVTRVHGAARHRSYGSLASCDVVVTSYPLLVRDEACWLEQSFSNLILDEAHVIKNPRSQVHRAALGIDAEHRLCLTGTPVENHLGELHALFEFMQPEFFGSVQRFRETYRIPIEQQGDDERLAALREQVAPYILRRLKSEVARELPPKTILVRPITLQGKQRELYESIRMAAHADVRRAIRKRGFGASTVAVLDALMKLRQLCCDPRLLSMEAARFVRQSAKYEMLMDLVDQQLGQGRRLLIFSQFTKMLGLISEGLQQRGVGHVSLTGSTGDRQRPVAAFESGQVDVFLISLKAGGVGLNLTSADTVIHYDPWWNPAAQAQATDRAYRIGQKKPVFVYNLMVAGSVEERMLQLQRRKQHLAQTTLGEAGSSALAEHEVEALLAPLEDGEAG